MFCCVLVVSLNLLLSCGVCLSMIQDYVSSTASALCLDVFSSSIKQPRCQVMFLCFKLFKYSTVE